MTNCTNLAESCGMVHVQSSWWNTRAAIARTSSSDVLGTGENCHVIERSAKIEFINSDEDQ